MSELKIGNEKLVELCDHLVKAARLAPTAIEIRDAITLAYNLGKADGAIEACDRIMATEKA